MTLLNALNEIKARGIENMSGRTVNELIGWATEADDIARRVLDTGIGSIDLAQYHIDHAEDNDIITIEGRTIIATWYTSGNGARFQMVTYHDYNTDTEAETAFDAWKIEQEANVIADMMSAGRSEELPRAAWVAIARAELTAAYKAANAAFKREYRKA